MKNIRFKHHSLATFGILSVATLINQSIAIADTHRVVLPVGTVIPVSLDRPLSSTSSQPGDKFYAVVKNSRDDAGLPIGTRIEGVVKESIPSSKGKPGVLDVDFRTMIFPNGSGRQAINASLYTLDGKEIRRQDGRLIATADKRKDRLKWVGIGAGAGLVLGTITKGNKAVDTLLGAGAGYLYNELQGKKAGDVKLKLGSEFGVRLESVLAFNMDGDSYRRVQTGYYDDAASGDKYRLASDTSSSNRTIAGDDKYFRGDKNSGSNVDRSDKGNDIGLMVDDREVRFSGARPYSKGEAILVPIETVAKAVGFDYRYDAGEKMIYAQGRSIRLSLDSRIAIINGERRRLPANAELKNGTIYVPMQFIGWATKGSASYDSGSHTVIITTEHN